MTEAMFGAGNDQWVCPNDRQLALRAKLHTGWSVHTFRTDKQRRSQALNQQELEMILSVIHRAEQLEQTEQHRIGRLVDRLENMRNSAVGNGRSQCLLCGEVLGLLGTPSVLCLGCCKKVCTKCAIETLCSQKKTQWLCKICSEHREVWKQSGAWFYKALPKYVRPGKEMAGRAHTLRGTQRGGLRTVRSSPVMRTYTWAHSKVVSSGSDSDSDQSEGSVQSQVSSQPSFPEGKQHTGSVSSGGLLLQTPPSQGAGPQDGLLADSRPHWGSELSLAPPAAPPEDFHSDYIHFPIMVPPCTNSSGRNRRETESGTLETLTLEAVSLPWRAGRKITRNGPM